MTTPEVNGALPNAELRRALFDHPIELRALIPLALEVALDRAGGNITRAARSLGLNRSSLYRRLQRARPSERTIASDSSARRTFCANLGRGPAVELDDEPTLREAPEPEAPTLTEHHEW